MKLACYLLIMVLIVSCIQGIYGSGVELSDIHVSGILMDINKNCSKYYIDKSISNGLLVRIKNNDNYQHNIKLSVKLGNKKSWESPLIVLPPKLEKNIDAKLYIDQIGSYNVQISVIDEKGKTITSKSTKILIASPIDVKNITCEEYYINNSNPNIEYCSSPYYIITLKNNQYSQSDYLVKTWIAVVSKDYNKDASKNKNDAGVLYYGEDDSKWVYIPIHGESTVRFKIPKIIQYNKDDIKIQVHTEIMSIHDYTDSPEETILNIDNNLNIVDSSKKYPKTFKYPISLENCQIVEDLYNETIRDMVREYYLKRSIVDDELEYSLRHRNYGNKLPRAYLKTDPYLVIANITLKNHCDYPVSGIITVEDSSGIHAKHLILDKFEIKNIYIPCNINYTGKRNIKITMVCSDTYQYNTTRELKKEPEKICLLKIDEIPEYSYDNITYPIINGNIDLIVGRNYTITCVLKNNYNKTLKGTLELKNMNFKKEGIVNYIDSIPFRIKSHSKRTYYIPITFYNEVNGDLIFTVKCNNSLTHYSKILHIHSHNPNADLKYVGNLKPKILVTNKYSQYDYYPVAGCINKFTVSILNPLDEDLKYVIWMESVDSQGNVKAVSCKKWIHIPPKSDSSSNFNLKFNEGFCGYIVLYSTLIDKNGNPTNTTVPLIIKSIDVVVPLDVSNISYDNSNIHANIVSKLFETFPVDINYNYWAEIVSENNLVIYRSKNYSQKLNPGEIKSVYIGFPKIKNKGNYTLKFYVDIPNFIEDNGEYKPLILEKDMVVYINRTSSGDIQHNNSKPQLSDSSKLSNPTKPTKMHNNNAKNATTISSRGGVGDNDTNNGNDSEGFLKNIYSAIMALISKIFNK